MKFAASYSCGKDSTLSLHKMIEQGHEPVCLVVMVNEEEGRSYFHGASCDMLKRYSEALALPIITCPASGADYQSAFEAGLAKARKMGAEAACFGDIDIDQNRQWEEDRCKATGLVPFFPLWQRGREESVYELMHLGYRCIIKSVNRTLLPTELLGKYIDEATVSVMKAAGIDVCGENGEYHTLAVDGPIFKKPLPFEMGERIVQGDYAIIDIH